MQARPSSFCEAYLHMQHAHSHQLVAEPASKWQARCHTRLFGMQASARAAATIKQQVKQSSEGTNPAGTGHVGPLAERLQPAC